MDYFAAQLLSHAVELARSGGRLARQRFGSAVTSLKPDRTPVTDADVLVQDHILDAIAARYPSHAVLTEEAIRRPERHASFDSAEWCWVIDPIDGTRNYARGVPSFSVSVGVLHHGQPAVAAVYLPMQNRMYSARLGAGAWCDDTRLHVADNPPTADTMIATPSGQGDPMPHAVHDWFDHMNIRNYGSTAMHLAMVAGGSVDAALGMECRLWDIAAGSLLFVLPIVVFTVLVRKHLLRGVTFGTVKQ